ncbi:hypothetical protein B0O99DRAFT_695390 [Bisporella sp. PMI_857]|nr:hypothetical protein B0O99DRAFT_695390 [Bisporella sp. PMI_857]
MTHKLQTLVLFPLAFVRLFMQVPVSTFNTFGVAKPTTSRYLVEAIPPRSLEPVTLSAYETIDGTPWDEQTTGLSFTTVIGSPPDRVTATEKKQAMVVIVVRVVGGLGNGNKAWTKADSAKACRIKIRDIWLIHLFLEC